MSSLPAARPTIALVLGLALTTAVGAAMPHVAWPVVVLLLSGWTALLCAGVGRRVAAVVVVLTWALADGFVENRYGQLSWHGQRELLLLGALTLSAGAATALTHPHRPTPAGAPTPLEPRWLTSSSSS